jgi:hypothetical protein
LFFCFIFVLIFMLYIHGTLILLESLGMYIRVIRKVSLLKVLGGKNDQFQHNKASIV